MKAMTRKFEIPIETAQRAARAALNEVERATGCFVIPEVKGQLCKQLAGIMANLSSLHTTSWRSGGHLLENCPRNGEVAGPLETDPDGLGAGGAIAFSAQITAQLGDHD
jgi:hypothetical protein